jgi:hypothetical protein
MLRQDEYYSEDADVDSSLTCNHSDNWKSSYISLANLRKAEFRGITGTVCELCFLQFVLANATDLQSVTVSFKLYFIEEEEDSRMCYFLHTLLEDGTWTACEDEDFDKPYKCSKLYKWTPSPFAVRARKRHRSSKCDRKLQLVLN